MTHVSVLMDDENTCTYSGTLHLPTDCFMKIRFILRGSRIFVYKNSQSNTLLYSGTCIYPDGSCESACIYPGL